MYITILRCIYNNLELKENKDQSIENGLCNENYESKKVGQYLYNMKLLMEV